MPTLTLKQIKREVKRLDSALKETDPSFDTAVILLAALQVGANDKKVSDFTGIPLGEVTKRGKRLRKNGIWKRGVTYADWANKESGGVAFWMDVCVADGLMSRSAK